MKKSLFAGMLITGLLSGAVFAADAQKFTGVLIDAKCGAKPAKDANPEQAAAKHPKACVIKCGKDGDLALISGKDMLKLDEASKTKAMDFLAKAESTKVTVEGTKDGDTLKIDKIEAAKPDAK
jgi:hypothetical protein